MAGCEAGSRKSNAGMGHWKGIELYSSMKPQLLPFAPAVDKWKVLRGEPLSKPCTPLWVKGRTHFSLLQGLRSSPEPCESSVRCAATRPAPGLCCPRGAQDVTAWGQGCTKPWMWVQTPLPAASACLFAGDKLLPFTVRVGTLLDVPPRKEGAFCLQATHQQPCRQSVGRREISYKKKEKSIRRHLPPNAHSSLAPLPRADVPQACRGRGGEAGTHRSGRIG